MKDLKYVAYYRVSTKKQGNSGLGLKDQQHRVKAFVNRDDCIIAEFVEEESGRRTKRTELDAAIALSKKEGATLIIAKLNRLVSNVELISRLNNSGVSFKCLDIPDLNTQTVGIFSTMAQHERELISSRTKAALAEKKKQGVKLGKPENLTDKARAKSIEVRVKAARESDNNKQVCKFIQNEKAKGKTLKEIAESLNQHGFKTTRGKEFKTGTVDMLLKRTMNDNKL